MKHNNLILTDAQEQQSAILNGVKVLFEDFKKEFQPKEPTEYLERKDVAKLLNVNLSTLHNWVQKGILKSYGIGRRVYFKRTEIEDAIVELKH